MQDNIIKNGPSKTYRRHPLKKLNWYGLIKQTLSLRFFQRMLSINFIWSILDYFSPCKTVNSEMILKNIYNRLSSNKNVEQCVDLFKVNDSNIRKNSLANVYLFKVNMRNTRKRCKICSKLIIKTPERRQWRRLVFSSLTLNIFYIFFQCFYCWLWTSKC